MILLKKLRMIKIVEKVNKMVPRGFVLKTKYNTDKSEPEKKFLMELILLKKTKITEIEGKIPDISGLATKTALTAIENKIPDVISLNKKNAYNTKISEIEKKISDHNHNKYITTPKLYTLAAGVFDERLAQANLITKTEFDTKLKSLNKNFNSNETRHLLDENELKKLKSIDLGYFIGKSHFDENGSQKYLAFKPILRYLTPINTGSWITGCKSKGLCN